MVRRLARLIELCWSLLGNTVKYCSADDRMIFLNQILRPSLQRRLSGKRRLERFRAEEVGVRCSWGFDLIRRLQSEAAAFCRSNFGFNLPCNLASAS